MQLNSILFPAPKCSYSVEKLQGELMWIPKYKKSQFPLTRLATLQPDKKTYFGKGSSSPIENSKNTIPQARSKKSMPRAQHTGHMASEPVGVKVKSRVMQSAAFERMPTDINDAFNFDPFHKRMKQPSFTVPSHSNSPNISILENSDIMDEGPTNTNKPPGGNYLKTSEACGDPDDITTGELSISFEDVPVKNMDPLSKTKRLLNHDSKDSKASTASQEGSLILDQNEHPPIAHEKKPSLKITNSREFMGMSFTVTTPSNNTKTKPLQHKKKLSIKINQSEPTPHLRREESKMSIDPELYEEYPLTAKVLSSPKTLNNYQTKCFFNPVSARASDSFNKGFQSARLGKNPFNASIAYTPREKMPVSFHKSIVNPTSSKPQPKETKETIEYYIPCMLLKSNVPTTKLIIYFHGNGEDIYLAYDLLSHIRNNLNIHVMAVEYPGYGLYKGASSDNQILSDAETVFDYLTNKLSMHPKDILVFGRSMGSGPATYLASRKNIGALILMSAFTSIRAVVRDLAGKWAQYLIKERFNNLEYMSRVTCPSFLIHGLKDNLIPYKQSQELHNACKGPCELVLPRDMDHIEFDFYEDFTQPLAFFLTRCNIQLRPRKGAKFEFPSFLFELPPLVEKQMAPNGKKTIATGAGKQF